MSAIPIISVVTPTKNRLPLLCAAMDSVRAQSFSEWEHIIVDDGSDDDTFREVEARAKTDPRIRYIRRSGDRTGANVCRNLGLAESRSQLIVFLDSDDLLRPDCLARRADIMLANRDLDFAVFRAGAFVNTVNDLGRLYHPQGYGDDLLRFLSHDYIWQTTGPVWRRGFLEKIGGFDEELLSMQDVELHVRAICAGAKYIRNPEVDHDIRWEYDFTRTSVRNMYELRFIKASEQVREKLLHSVTRAGLLTWSRQRALLGLAFGAAEGWLRTQGLKAAISVWNREGRRYGATTQFRLAGIAMLFLSRFASRENSLCFRIVNRWKGWVRFRQEPDLLLQAGES